MIVISHHWNDNGDGTMAGASLLRTAVVAVLAATLSACQPEAETVRAPDPVVMVETARPVSMADSWSFTGVVRPRDEIPQAFRIAGKLVERPVEVGDRVSAGDVIARLDTVDLELAVEQADAAVAAARSNLARAEEAQGRSRVLFGKGHAPQSDVDGRRLATDEARARLQTAERQRDLARNQRAYAELRATADGVVSSVVAEPGAVVAAGAPVVVIARADAPEVLVAVPESRIADLDGASADVTLWAGGHDYPARLREIAPEADPATRTYAARFTVLEADDAVRLGMTATVTLVKGDPRKVFRVGSASVVDEGRGPAVFTVDPATSRLARRPVEIGRYERDGVIVLAGLEAGDRVVALGAARLQDGQAVRVAETP
jgi:RND family efflux transporter MFP subunit